MSLDLEFTVLSGSVNKTQSSYFAYSEHAEIYVGEWHRGRSKLTVQCDSIFSPTKTDPPVQVALKAIRVGASSRSKVLKEQDMVCLIQAF